MAAEALTFDPFEHSYRVGMTEIPGVTRILQQIDELDGIPRDLLEAARRFGSHVHIACDLSNKGLLDEASLDPALKPYLDAWRKFLFESNVKIIESELRVLNNALGYAGTLDAIICWRGVLHVVDVKTSAQVPRSVGPQLAAYRAAYLSQNSDQQISLIRYCVHLQPDGRYQLHRYKDPSDFHIFLSCLNLYNWRNKR